MYQTELLFCFFSGRRPKHRAEIDFSTAGYSTTYYYISTMEIDIDMIDTKKEERR